MKFYKLIQDTNFIGIASSENFKKYNEGSGLLLTANEVNGQFVRVGTKLYRDSWMVELPSKTFRYEEANIIEITEKEYQEILVISQQENPDYHEYIEPDYPEPEPIPEPEDPNDAATLAYIKSQKIAQMSTACRITIENGFDLELRGETNHFSLTTQDQLNLMSLNAMTGTQQLIPYHADGEECTFYTAEEINQIINAAQSFKNYQIAYYNALKTYINALDNIDSIVAITYGTPIPDEYKSDVLRVLE